MNVKVSGIRCAESAGGLEPLAHPRLAALNCAELVDRRSRRSKRTAGMRDKGTRLALQSQGFSQSPTPAHEPRPSSFRRARRPRRRTRGVAPSRVGGA